MSATTGRERILLNLKWFMHRLLNTFEQKLQQTIVSSISGRISSTQSSPGNSYRSPLNHRDRPVNNILDSVDELHSPTPIRRSTDYDDDDRDSINSHNSLSSHPGFPTHDLRSPVSSAARPRSLTNSPFFRRFAFASQLGRKRNHHDSLLLSSSGNKTHSNGSLPEREYFSTSLLGGLRNNDSLPSSILTAIKFSDHRIGRLYHLTQTSTASERRNLISLFAQNLCIAYEYQLGMLRGIKSIHAAADYVALFVIKSLKHNLIQSLDPDQLSAEIFFQAPFRNTGASRCVKTMPLTVTGEQLTWRLGDLFLLPGLRHNEVGGENCHNLSIVTHFLSVVTDNGVVTRPDIYGYRNLILHTKTSDKYGSVQLVNRKKSDENQSGYGRTTTTLSTLLSDEITSELYFDLISLDQGTIAVNKVRSGGRSDLVDSTDSLNSTSSNNQQAPSSLSPALSQTVSAKRITSHPTSSAATIRQHLHRAYRPVFFVIFNKPSVIEHLTECDSFAAFCKRQSLSPVMFLNQPTQLFWTRPYPCLYQNFDLFNVNVSGYTSTDQTTVNCGDLVDKKPNIPFSNLNQLISTESIGMLAKKCQSMGDQQTPTLRPLAAFDNPGFDR